MRYKIITTPSGYVMHKRKWWNPFWTLVGHRMTWQDCIDVFNSDKAKESK